MRMRSMTGYGRGDRETAGWRVSAELRSLNHRGLDIRFTAPPALAGIEGEVRRRVAGLCFRGRLECRLFVDAPPPDAVNPALLEAARRLHTALTAIARDLALADSVDLRDLLIAGLDLHPTAIEPPEALSAAALGAVEDALAGLVAARDSEGAALRDDFGRRLARVGELLSAVEELAVKTAARFRRGLRERLERDLAELGLEGLDGDALWQDLVTLLDRSDITEEVVRAGAHTAALLALLAGEEAPGEPLGKRFDFFLQELIRESNTMASKSMSAELTARVVDVKVEIERMREQVQNVE